MLPVSSWMFISLVMVAPEFILRGHIWLECPGGLEIGPGRAALLAQIRDQGSIRKAADALGLTYRQAWARVKAMNATAGCALVERTSGGRQGGGATLTTEGQLVLHAFQKEELRFSAFLHQDPLSFQTD